MKSAMNGFRVNFIRTDDDNEVNETISMLSKLKYSSSIGIVLNYDCLKSESIIFAVKNEKLIFHKIHI